MESQNEQLVQISPFQVDEEMIKKLEELSKFTLTQEMKDIEKNYESAPSDEEKGSYQEFVGRGLYDENTGRWYKLIQSLYGSQFDATFIATRDDGWLYRIFMTDLPTNYIRKPDEQEINDIFNRFKRLQNVDSNHVSKYFAAFRNQVYGEEKIIIVLEQVPNKNYNFVNFFNRMTQNKPESLLTVKNLVSLLAHLAMGIYNMHSVGVAHRDLRFGTIVVDINENGNTCFKISDLGSQRCVNGEDSTNWLIKSVFFSPEIIRFLMGSETVVVDLSKNDIWSLGIIFFVLTSGGRHPFLNEWEEMKTIKDTDFLKRIYTPSKKITADKVGTPNKKLAELVAKMLTVDQDQRPSIQEVCKTLSEILETLGEEGDEIVEYINFG